MKSKASNIVSSKLSRNARRSSGHSHSHSCRHLGEIVQSIQIKYCLALSFLTSHNPPSLPLPTHSRYGSSAHFHEPVERTHSNLKTHTPRLLNTSLPRAQCRNPSAEQTHAVSIRSSSTSQPPPRIYNQHIYHLETPPTLSPRAAKSSTFHTAPTPRDSRALALPIHSVLPLRPRQILPHILQNRPQSRLE